MFSRIRLVGKRFRSNKGMSLLEILVAVAVLGIALAYLISLSSNGLKNAGTSRNRALADQYAREGIELMRSYRDNKGWPAFRRVANTVDWAIFGSSGPTSPTCTISYADRYYYVFEVPASGIPTLGTNGVACGSNSEFNNPSTWHGQWLNNWCNTTTWTTQPTGSPYLLRGQVVPNFYRAVIVGFETTNRAFIRSVTCYYEGGNALSNIRSVQVDSYLTNWR